MKQLFTLGLALVLAAGSAFAQPRAASAPVRLISAPQGLMAPVWSPDGSKIAVTSDNYSGIYVANADGSALHQVTAASGAGYRMAWNGNNTIVANERTQLQGRNFYTQCAYNTTDGTRTARRDARRAAASTDGATGIYAAMVESPAATGIAALKAFDGKIIINPAMSPDGQKIAFQVPSMGMWLINADGSGLRQLGAGSHPAWMPDSRTILYTVVEDNGAVFTASTLKALDTNSGRESVISERSASIIPMSPAVSPDGKKVVFENAADNAIYLINLK